MLKNVNVKGLLTKKFRFCFDIWWKCSIFAVEKVNDMENNTIKRCEHCKHFVEGIDACMLCGYMLGKCIRNDFKLFDAK